MPQDDDKYPIKERLSLECWIAGNLLFLDTVCEETVRDMIASLKEKLHSIEGKCGIIPDHVIIRATANFTEDIPAEAKGD